jgi:hypothetical protein
VTIDGQGPQSAWRRNPVEIVATLAGIVVTFISLAAMSWYSVSGPYVVSRLSDLGSGDGNFVSLGYPEPMFLVDSDVGSHHSWVAWSVFALCSIAAIVAGIWLGARPALSIIAIALAVVLMAGTVYRVVVVHVILGDDPILPPDTNVTVQAGFWATQIGLALIVAGSAAALRRDAQPRQSRRVPV